MSSIANEDTRVPVPDPMHVVKLVRSGLFDYWVPYAIYKGGFFEISFVVDTHLPRFEAIAYVLLHFDALTQVVVLMSSASSLKPLLRSS